MDIIFNILDWRYLAARGRLLFRTHRLGEDTLDKMMTEMARQCVEEGLLNHGESRGRFS